ncbi:hypothetical protein KSP39_PZI001902 [Platanthera zijinensis]|uniref:Uncharacterized protein n=1 Tax=Platanthera zijinensis TaxID=2320716 RepID=A0AAP0BZR8_9ASPA
MASGAEEDGVQHPESPESDRVIRCKEAARFLAKIRGAEREKRRRLVLRRRAQRLNGGKENKTFSPGGAPRNIDGGRRNPGSGTLPCVKTGAPAGVYLLPDLQSPMAELLVPITAMAGSETSIYRRTAAAGGVAT